jgi:acetyl esterase/lipase
MPAVVETHVYKSVGGFDIRADVIRPSAPAKASPAIVFFHGGALIFGTRKHVNPDEIDRFLDAGYAVVSADYRLAPETKLPGIMEDVADVFAWVRREGPRAFGIDPERVAAMGQSAGGYLTLMSGYWVRPRPKALLSFYGYGDIAGKWYAEPDPFYCQEPAVAREEAFACVGNEPLSEPEKDRWPFYLYSRQQGLWPKLVAGFDPATERAGLDKYCPLRHVTADYPPTILLHGDADTDVPYQQSVLMAGELSRAGVTNELVTIPGGPHGFDGEMSNPVASAAVDQAVAFLDMHVGRRK